ncbi:nucleotide-diphospho-sugar transferase family protein [Rhynchospora pubera]|uniref:Nucleotide-diphospho-sugar transferase family protein n=1 Tax=Rhynchospora pubera TaxID=906938 RepID=A0AAV8C1R1_9POAL|nr:nucleotide-diphospho-sugar transferase family protein [Rhynchospora pubera]
MMKKESTSSNNLQQVISFLLGASVASVLLFFILSANRGDSYIANSSWSSTSTKSAQEILSSSSDIIQATDHAKTPLPKKPKGDETKFSTKESERNETSYSPSKESEVTDRSSPLKEPEKNETKSSPKEFERNETKLSTTNETKYSDNLEDLLRKAATKEKNIIMTSVNEAWAAPDSLLGLFLESFHSGEDTEHFLNNLIIITLDPKAFERCKAMHPFCYMLKGANFAGEKVYMTSDYFDLVWTKVKLQQRILQLGYNFLFTDVDIMWFRNPFERFASDADISTSCDFFFGDENSPWNFPNTGFLYVKSNPKNIELFKYWHESRDKFPPNHEQWVFNQIKFDVVNRMQLKIQFLSTTYNMGFCNSTKDFDKLYTMHANCCVGIGAKMHDLRMLLDDWNKYKTITKEERKKGPVSWRVPGICMH